MEHLNIQLMDGLFKLLTAKPVNFVLDHSLAIGFITGVLSLIPFWIKQIPHLVILVIFILSAFYIKANYDISYFDVFYKAEAFFLANLVGNYIFGCIGGLVIANLIQRIRGEHDHAINN